MIISKTPLRASFFGGGTDFSDYFHNSKFGYGCVLSTALNMHVYITVNRLFDEKIRLAYTGNELVDSVDQVQHNIIREDRHKKRYRNHLFCRSSNERFGNRTSFFKRFNSGGT